MAPRPSIAIGLDGQLWAATCSRIYVLILYYVRPVPNSVSEPVGSDTKVYVTEPRSVRRSFNAVSNNQAVATVTSGEDGHLFRVHGVAAGTTTVTFSDTIGNSVDIPVTIY